MKIFKMDDDSDERVMNNSSSATNSESKVEEECGIFEFCAVKPEPDDDDDNQESMDFLNFDIKNEDDEIEMSNDFVEVEDNTVALSNDINSVSTASKKAQSAKSNRVRPVAKRKQWCITPNCSNNGTRNPEKMFFKVPKNNKKRRQWLTILRHNPDNFQDNSHLYICEDHFNLEKDMVNYKEFKLMGGIRKLKTGVVPHIFEWQTEEDDKASRKNENKSARKSKVASVNRARKKMLKDILRSSNLLFTVNKPITDDRITILNTSVPNISKKDVTPSKGQSKIFSDLNDRSYVDNSKNNDGDTNDDDDKISKDDDDEITEDDSDCGKDEDFSFDDYDDDKDDNGLETSQEQSTIVIDSSDEDDADLTDNSAVDKDEVFYRDDRGNKTQRGCAITPHYARTMHAIKHNSTVRQKSFLPQRLPYKCHLCERSYETAICLKAHMLFHTNIQYETCKICDETFKTNYLLLQHLSTHDSSQNSTSKSSETSKKSVKIHAVHKKYVCPICDNKFSRNAYLFKHLQKHKNAKVFACDKCHKAFIHKVKLIRHINTVHSNK